MMNDTMRFFFLAFLFVLLFLSEKVQGQAVSWGDQGNGTYINPILNADYSDPVSYTHLIRYFLLIREQLL